MIKSNDLNQNEMPYWVELANGGGVMLRDPTVALVSPAPFTRRRRANEPLPARLPPPAAFTPTRQ